MEENSQESSRIDKLGFLGDLRAKYSHQPVFLQSVEEIALSLLPLFSDPEHGAFYKRAFIAMTEPERTISFRVPWEDDQGNMHFNRGWRVEFSRYDWNWKKKARR
jgi:glutamate dehydrogenase (NADP+)